MLLKHVVLPDEYLVHLTVILMLHIVLFSSSIVYRCLLDIGLASPIFGLGTPLVVRPVLSKNISVFLCHIEKF